MKPLPLHFEFTESDFKSSAAGKVYLVGAGPGDAGLLSVKGKHLLEQADAVVYDRLISPRLLQYAQRSAERIYVGKASSNHTLSQAEINQLLVRLASAGKCVVRLKGGDPFVFGRGGEEALALDKAGVRWEVVPGITSAVAVSAYAGIPLTHRQVSPMFTVVTGHECLAVDETTVEWNGLAQGTLIVLMGVAQLQRIVRRLLAAGRLPSTPVAVVSWGTRAGQQTVEATLETAVHSVTEAGIASPAIIIVGDVVRLRNQLAWSEQRPLAGRCIVVAHDTDSEAQRLSDSLELLGAETVHLSVERIVQKNPQQIANAVSLLRNQSVIKSVIFTGVAEVRAFAQYLRYTRVDVRELTSVEFLASHEEVVEALWELGFTSVVCDAMSGISRIITDEHTVRLDTRAFCSYLPITITLDGLLISWLAESPVEFMAATLDADKHLIQPLQHWLAKQKIQSETFSQSESVVTFA